MTLPRMLVALFMVSALVLGAAPVDAAPEPNVGCSGPVVEFCQPICVKAPCWPYFCVHARHADICVTF